MHKAVETAKPYTDAVAHKTEEIIHQIQASHFFMFREDVG
jgi:hypothetical protein